MSAERDGVLLSAAKGQHRHTQTLALEFISVFC